MIPNGIPLAITGNRDDEDGMRATGKILSETTSTHGGESNALHHSFKPGPDLHDYSASR